jgi:hypothetical protein
MADLSYKFIIVTQLWDSHSNGVSILYKLAEYIERCGFTSQIYIWNIKRIPDNTPNKIKNKIVQNVDWSDEKIISILPESLPYEISKKLGGKKRIWYLLNKPMVLTGEKIHIEPSDYFVSYSPLVDNNEPLLPINNKYEEIDATIDAVLKNEILKKKQIVVYSGKCRKKYFFRYLLVNIIFGVKVIAISRSIPEDKKDLYKVISDSRLFITYDPFTSTAYEATLCGTPAYIADNYTNNDLTKHNIPLYGVFTDWRLISKYYREGIKKDVYYDVVDTYRKTTENHLQQVSSFLSRAIIYFENQDKNSEKNLGEHLKRKLRFDTEFKKNQIHRNLINHSLIDYVPIYRIKTLTKLKIIDLLIFILNLYFLIFRCDLEMINNLRTCIAEYRHKLIHAHTRELINS